MAEVTRGMNWRTIRRETGLIEHVCEHGTGHPNAGSIQYMEYMTTLYRDWVKEENYDLVDRPVPQEPLDSAWGIHGCDGCCQRSDFPGHAIGAIRHAIERYKEERPDKYDDLFHDHFLLFWGILAAVDEAERLGIDS